MITDRSFKKYEGSGSGYTVADGTERIGDLAFSGADGLEWIEIPETVKSIGNYAFMNCYSLREIQLPERIEHIGAGLFQNCWQLRSVKLPEGTRTLGTDMFENCHALAEITIPSTLEQAARTSLSGCRSLRTIHIAPAQIELLPPSARYTAMMSYMEANSRGGADEGSDIIDGYVRERQNSFLDLAINRKSTEAVRYMMEHQLSDEDAIREYIHRSAAAGRTEISALLLEAIKGSTPADALNEDPFL